MMSCRKSYLVRARARVRVRVRVSVRVRVRVSVMQEVVPYVPGASAAGRAVTAPEPAVRSDGALEAARRVGGQHGAVVGQRAVYVQDLDRRVLGAQPTHELGHLVRVRVRVRVKVRVRVRVRVRIRARVRASAPEETPAPGLPLALSLSLTLS